MIEHYLDSIAISRREFATGMTGGWLFGYAQALSEAGLPPPCILAHSREVDAPERHVHPETGVVTVFLPQPALGRLAARWPGDADDPDCGRFGAPQRWARHAAVSPAGFAEALAREGCDTLIVQEYEHPRFDRLVGLQRRGFAVLGSFQGAPAPMGALETRVRARSIRAAAGLIIGPGAEAARVEVAYGLPADRIARIPNPIDLTLWYPEAQDAARTALGIAAQETVFVCHGRIAIGRKGLDLLLAAWRKVTVERPDMRLTLRLVGDGPDAPELARMIDADPPRGLHWVRKFVNDRAYMRQELSAADAYVLASRHEGFAVAPLEAMACGLPVVAARASGIDDVFPQGPAQGGLLARVGDADALAHAIGRLVDAPDLRRNLAAAARDRVAAFCSMGSVGNALASFIQTCHAHPSRH